MSYFDHQVHSPVLDKCGKPAKLYVVAPIINAARYKARYNLFRHFEEYINKSDAILYKVEVAYGSRPFLHTSPDDPRSIQLRTNDELWHKENMLNIGISRLPVDSEYVAWIDTDVTFARPDWVNEAIHQLQHYDFVQMFSIANDLDHNHHVMGTSKGFMYSYVQHLDTGIDYGYWHSGFAWCARKDALSKVGGLIDYCIVGSADYHMAWALIGQIEKTLSKQLSQDYKDKLMYWQELAEKYIKRNVGYMSGTLNHGFHGKKIKRGYQTRYKILTENNYEPSYDLKKDWSGLYTFASDKIKLRDQLRSYFRSRSEDGLNE